MTSGLRWLTTPWQFWQAFTRTDFKESPKRGDTHFRRYLRQRGESTIIPMETFDHKRGWTADILSSAPEPCETGSAYTSGRDFQSSRGVTSNATRQTGLFSQKIGVLSQSPRALRYRPNLPHTQLPIPPGQGTAIPSAQRWSGAELLKPLTLDPSTERDRGPRKVIGQSDWFPAPTRCKKFHTKNARATADQSAYRYYFSSVPKKNIITSEIQFYFLFT